MMEKETDDSVPAADTFVDAFSQIPALAISIRSPSVVVSSTLVETTDTKVAVRVQPSRASKAQVPALFTGKEPELTEKTEEQFQMERVKKFGHVYGLRFNALITAWQSDSKHIREFFLDGAIPFDRFKYRSHLQWNASYTQLLIAKSLFVVKDRYDQLLDLDAFWNVMTKGPLETFPRDTVLYRGVRLYPGEQLPNLGYVVENVLTNWSSSPKVGSMFANNETGALYMATFPKGTRYFYTGETFKEFEYIIPGGTFQLSKYPKVVKNPLGGEVTLLEFRYIPGKQFFPWPSKSPSPSTRAMYQQSLEINVFPDLIQHHLTLQETTTLTDIVQEFDKLTKRAGYTGTKTLLDYPVQFRSLVDPTFSFVYRPPNKRISPERTKQLLADYAVLEKTQKSKTATATAAALKPANFIINATAKVGGTPLPIIRFQPRVRTFTRVF